MTRALVVVTGDWHVNDTVGLCPPRIRLDDGGTYRPSKEQRQIWRAWLALWGKVADLKREYQCPVVAVCNGDLGDVNKHDGVQLVTVYRPAIQDAMLDVCKMMLDVADKVIIIRGTAAHSGGSGELEEWLARDIGAVSSPTGTASWWIWKADIEGVTFDVSHHPPTGTSLSGKRGQAAARAAERVALDYLRYRVEPPKVAVAHHNHFWGCGQDMGVWFYYGPPLKWVGAFGHRIGKSYRAEAVGGLIFKCQDGQFNSGDAPYFLREPKEGKRWMLTG